MPPHSKFLPDSPSQGNSTYPCDREKGTASAVPPVNLWLSSDRASRLEKRQKGQLGLSPCQSVAFIGPPQRSGKKDKRANLRHSSCQFMAFIGPRQRPGKKTKGTTSAVPPVNLRLLPDRASGLGKRQKGQPPPFLPSIYGFYRPRQRSGKKDKRYNLRRSSCQSMAFIGPRQRSGKKTKGTACAVPPVYGVIIKFR